MPKVKPRKKVKSPQGFAREQERKRLEADPKFRQQIFHEETMKRGGYSTWEVGGFDDKGKPILIGPMAKANEKKSLFRKSNHMMA